MPRDGKTAGERTRARVLDVALPLFAEHGFAGTSVRMVANAAEVNVATLAYHFTDKAGLYAAVIQRGYDELAHIPVQMDSGLRGVVRDAWRYATSHRTLLRLLHRHFLDQGAHHQLAAGVWSGPAAEGLRAMIFQARTDWQEHEFRMLIYTVLHLLVRFALEEPEQLARDLQIEGSTEDAMVGWLAEVMHRMLGLPTV